ncbi:MAG: deoxyribonuclease-1 [Bacteroidia bacterium]|jgi:deoxyribonuclease-1
MKKGLFIAFMLLNINVFSQLTLSTKKIVFDETVVGNYNLKYVKIINLYKHSVDVEFISHNADIKAEPGSLSIPAQGSYDITLKFEPTHNVSYNSEIVLKTNSNSGSYSIDVTGQGAYAESYYASTKNLWEQDLKDELKSILAKNYKNLGYNGARDAMYSDIDNSGGVVTCVYTGKTATFNSRSGANDNGFNCEHTWPQSLFNSNEPERADIHHLFPTDVGANSRRGNYPFNIVSSSTWEVGGSKANSSEFEPRDLHKGDVARAMFYFATRYTNYSSFLTGQESVLRSWSTTYMPSQESRDRNEAIFGYQKNRNPYVDHPEFLNRITSISNNSVAASIYELKSAFTSINFGDVGPGFITNFILVLTNTGNQTIEITDVSCDLEELRFTNKAFVILPGESEEVRIEIIRVGSTSLGMESGKIQVTTKNGGTDKQVPVQFNMITLGLEKALEEESSIQHKHGLLIIESIPKATFQIVSQMGQKIYLNEIKSKFTEIETSFLPSGAYFAVLIDPNGKRMVKSFVVVH